MKRKILIGLGIAAVLGALLYAVLMAVSAGARETVRDFTFAVSSGDYDAAIDLMHPALAKEAPIDRLQEIFGTTKPFTTVEIFSFQISNSQATVQGIATTQDGCVSALDFSLLSEQVTKFAITPLCTVD